MSYKSKSHAPEDDPERRATSVLAASLNLFEMGFEDGAPRLKASEAIEFASAFEGVCRSDHVSTLVDEAIAEPMKALDKMRAMVQAIEDRTSRRQAEEAERNATITVQAFGQKR